LRIFTAEGAENTGKESMNFRESRQNIILYLFTSAFSSALMTRSARSIP